MKIVADQNIVGLKELIEPIAQLTMVEGRQLTNAQLKNADALLVRSVTEVNRELLANTPVSFVGSATAGQDHIDHGYLKAAGIAFSAAPGSNANSVVEYVISALANIRGCLEGLCKSGSVGIVGFGQVGSLSKRQRRRSRQRRPRVSLQIPRSSSARRGCVHSVMPSERRKRRRGRRSWLTST